MSSGLAELYLTCPRKESGCESVRKGLATLFLNSQRYSTITLGSVTGVHIYPYFKFKYMRKN